MRSFLPWSLLIVTAVAACTGSEPEATSALAPATERFAVVALTWSAPSSPGRQATGPDAALAQAYFVEHAAGERASLLDLLHLPAANVAFDPAIAPDACVVSHAEPPSQAVLLDAGELTIETEEGPVLMDSSYVPDGTMRVSGLVYEGAVATRAAAAIVADGSDEVGPFVVTLAAPPPMRLVTIGGEPVVRGRVEIADALSEPAGLAVAWDAPDGPYDGVLARDVAVVTFERRAFGDAWMVACVVQDDGAFVVPGPALQGLPDLGSDATDRIVVRRLAGTSFSAPGMPDGLALAIAEDAAYLE
ncbi:MAG: hypothetical protein IT385_27585 [Deltaproteobacteria bacterium]|nr:hypothetical protein [Deltaproteobacteria bacterium]